MIIDSFKIEMLYDRVTPNEYIIVDGTGNESVAWRNIYGAPCYSVDITDYDSFETMIAPAGIYTIFFVDATHVTISSSYPEVKLSPAIETGEIEVYVGVNYQIISGLNITLGEYFTSGDKFQIIIGGFYRNAEQRIIKGLIFDPITAGTTPSDEVKLKITNDSGYNLKGVYATILNKISLYQTQNMYDLVTLIPDRELVLFVASHETDNLSNDIIMRLTSANEPIPYRVVASHDTLDGNPPWNSYYPFSNLGGTLDHQFGSCKKWYIPYSDTTLWEEGTIWTERVIIEEGTVYIRYDFGRDNFVSFNRLGLACDKMTRVILEGSDENVDDPTEWEELLVWDDIENSHCYDEYYYVYGGTGDERYPMSVQYKNFNNLKKYRHYRLSPTNVIIWTYPSSTDFVPAIARVEFIQAPVGDFVTYRNRPFDVLYQESDIAPVFNSNDEELTITLDNQNDDDDTIDILVDKIGYDVIDVETGKIYLDGAAITSDVLYQFADGSPLAGAFFIINDYAIEGDFCFVWISQGTNVFELKETASGTWTNEKITITGSTALEDGHMDNSDYALVSIRSNPGKDVVGSDDYPIEALLYVYGQSDTEYDESLPSQAYTINTAGDKLGTIRQEIKNLYAKGEEIRFKFKSIGGLSINEAYFGLNFPGSPSFQQYPQKVKITFSGSGSLSIVGAGEQWSDWVSYNTDADNTYVASYSGSVIGNKPSVDSGELAFYAENHHNANINTLEYYETEATNFDISEIEVRSKLKFSKVIPMSAVVNKSAKNLEIKATIISSEISTALSDFGIEWVEIT